MIHTFDVLIIGSGLAGLTAALKLAPTHRVAVVTKRGIDTAGFDMHELALASEGCTVFINGRDQPRLLAAAAELQRLSGGSITPVQAAPISAAVQVNACWQIRVPSPGLPRMLPTGTRTLVK